MNRTEHLLSLVAEECAEIAQRATKAQRFGLEDVQPGQKLTNAQKLVLEYADLSAVFEMLVRNVPENVHEWIDREREQHRMSQQEFVLSVLLKSASTQTLPLPFEAARHSETGGDLPFTFIDLFAGIGGFRLALQGVGGTCTFSNRFPRLHWYRGLHSDREEVVESARAQAYQVPFRTDEKKASGQSCERHKISAR